MSIPLARLASISLIRGFVAVGRRNSITLAAEDLCVTQSAVSRQVLALERSLGLKLLVRSHRAIRLTAAGERLFRVADGAIRQLQEVTSALVATAARPAVTISASIGFSGLWLLPRLGALQKRHPDIEVRIATTNRVVDLSREGVDIAIRYATQAAAPGTATRLFGESIAPVAHPSLGIEALNSARIVSQQVLLEFDDPQHPFLQWHEWLQALKWGRIKTKGLLRFNQYDQVIHAAMAGQGIALGRLELIGPLLADGRLVQLPAPQKATQTDYAYWLVQASKQPRPDVLSVIDWLYAEARGVVQEWK